MKRTRLHPLAIFAFCISSVSCVFTACDDKDEPETGTLCDKATMPAGATTCNCKDGTWTDCTYSEDKCKDAHCDTGTKCDPSDGQCKPIKCDDNKKPADAISCECKNGEWTDCTYSEDKCKDINCDPGTKCDPSDGQCKPTECDDNKKPTDAISCECKNGEWTECTYDKCKDIYCDPGTKCDPSDGQCKPVDCDESQKPDCPPKDWPMYPKCIQGKWECIDSCFGVTCDPGTKCDPSNGVCHPVDCDPDKKPDCAYDIKCDKGEWTCVDPCSEIYCDPGTVCDPADGQCKPKCDGVACDSGMICDPEDGQCKPDPSIPKECNSAWPTDAIMCECVAGEWECSFPPESKCKDVNCLGGQHCNADDGECYYDEIPALVLDVAKDTIEENGDSTRINIKLNGEPSSDVFIYVKASGYGKDISWAYTTYHNAPQAFAYYYNQSQPGSALRIVPKDWEKGPVSIFWIKSKTDYEDTDDQTLKLEFFTKSDDKQFDNLSTTTSITIRNTDIAGIILKEPENYYTTEDGSSIKFEFSLSSKPKNDVLISPQLLPNEYAHVDNKISFSQGDWNKQKVIMVKGLDDGNEVNKTAHTYQLLFEVTSQDKKYNNYAINPITLTNLDNDSPNILHSTFNLIEGETSQFELSVSDEPSDQIVITATVGPEENCKLNNDKPIIINPSGQNNKAVGDELSNLLSITAIDDNYVNNTGLHPARTCTITLTTSSSNPVFDGITETTTVTIKDDDKIGINLITKNILPMCMAETATKSCPNTQEFCFTLNSIPNSAVRIVLLDPGYNNYKFFNIEPSSLIIQPEQYNSPNNCYTFTNNFDGSVTTATGHLGTFTSVPYSTSSDSRYDKILLNNIVIEYGDIVCDKEKEVFDSKADLCKCNNAARWFGTAGNCKLVCDQEKEVLDPKTNSCKCNTAARWSGTAGSCQCEPGSIEYNNRCVKEGDLITVEGKEYWQSSDTYKEPILWYIIKIDSSSKQLTLLSKYILAVERISIMASTTWSNQWSGYSLPHRATIEILPYKDPKRVGYITKYAYDVCRKSNYCTPSSYCEYSIDECTTGAFWYMLADPGKDGNITAVYTTTEILNDEYTLQDNVTMGYRPEITISY